MQAFDSLPAPIRSIIAACAYDSRATMLAPKLRSMLVGVTPDALAAQMGAVLAAVEEQTLRRVAADHLRLYREVLPHVAAKATILR